MRMTSLLLFLGLVASRGTAYAAPIACELKAYSGHIGESPLLYQGQFTLPETLTDPVKVLSGGGMELFAGGAKSSLDFEIAPQNGALGVSVKYFAFNAPGKFTERQKVVTTNAAVNASETSYVFDDSLRILELSTRVGDVNVQLKCVDPDEVLRSKALSQEENDKVGKENMKLSCQYARLGEKGEPEDLVKSPVFLRINRESHGNGFYGFAYTNLGMRGLRAGLNTELADTAYTECSMSFLKSVKPIKYFKHTARVKGDVDTNSANMRLSGECRPFQDKVPVVVEFVKSAEIRSANSGAKQSAYFSLPKVEGRVPFKIQLNGSANKELETFIVPPRSKAAKVRSFNGRRVGLAPLSELDLLGTMEIQYGCAKPADDGSCSAMPLFKKEGVINGEALLDLNIYYH